MARAIAHQEAEARPSLIPGVIDELVVPVSASIGAGLELLGLGTRCVRHRRVAKHSYRAWTLGRLLPVPQHLCIHPTEHVRCPSWQLYAAASVDNQGTSAHAAWFFTAVVLSSNWRAHPHQSIGGRCMSSQPHLVPHDSSQTAGVKLLQLMGWRPGRGIGSAALSAEDKAAGAPVS